jgi:hypothetical protein
VINSNGKTISMIGKFYANNGGDSNGDETKVKDQFTITK